jgi:CTP synthase (UTP-ammonia lyase)
MPNSRSKIALVGDFNPAVLAHRAIDTCFTLARASGSPPVEPVWVATEKIVPGDTGVFDGFRAIWCVPASPYRNTEGALWAIRNARENHIPFLGTCGGFQHALLEYARNVLGLKTAAHAETDPTAPLLLLTRLSCSLVEQTRRVIVTPGSPFREIYGAESGLEGFHCNFGLNPTFENLFHDGPLEIAARSEEGDVRAVWLRGHPFFVGTLFQPERRALEGQLHPVVRAFFQSTARPPTTITAGRTGAEFHSQPPLSNHAG